MKSDVTTPNLQIPCSLQLLPGQVDPQAQVTSVQFDIYGSLLAAGNSRGNLVLFEYDAYTVQCFLQQNCMCEELSGYYLCIYFF